MQFDTASQNIIDISNMEKKVMLVEIEKSERQRYEITSVSQIFNQQNKLRIQKLSLDCIWFDTNTFDGIMNSCLHIQKLC